MAVMSLTLYGDQLHVELNPEYVGEKLNPMEQLASKSDSKLATPEVRAPAGTATVHTRKGKELQQDNWHLIDFSKSAGQKLR